jgi:arsenite methyltransferase
VLAAEGYHVTGLDRSETLLARAEQERGEDDWPRFVRGDYRELPFEDASFDAVLSNGVINLSPDKGRVFAEAARVLRPGGRLAIADIVSGRPLQERTRRNVELWAACVAGAISRGAYLQALDAHGLRVAEVRRNDYRFTSERAAGACRTYAVESISVLAAKP